MNYYANLIILGLTGIVLYAFLNFQVKDANVAFIATSLAYVLSLIITFLLTKKELEEKYEGRINQLKEEHTTKIRRLKKEHDMTTLEKTIRDGTQTLIKNAVDYFKIENIKNEMPTSAAIQNLQLDKYGQIIELLADFSLILPDYNENRQIVEDEIRHQIEIYQIDENAFAVFLKRIMDKYLITVNKKMREKEDLETIEMVKTCPECAEKVMVKAKVCRFCGYEFSKSAKVKEVDAGPASLISKSGGELEWIKKGIELEKQGHFQEAIKLFTIAIDLNPKSSDAYFYRGTVHQKTDNPIMAADDFKAAAKLGNQKAKKVLERLSLSETQEQKWN